MSDYYDISGKIGDLYPSKDEPEWPMYSYSRPAWMLWNAIACEMRNKGWTDHEIKTWLQSKHPRWALDGTLGDMLRDTGKQYGEMAVKVEGE